MFLHALLLVEELNYYAVTWDDQETANQKACSNYDHNYPITNDVLYPGFMGFKHMLMFSVAQTVNIGC